jgi:1,4-alpha-glucan branching enzyme
MAKEAEKVIRKTAAKAAEKAEKAVAKAAVRTVAKSAVKSAVKSAAKSTAKATVKTAEKTAAKAEAAAENGPAIGDGYEFVHDLDQYLYDKGVHYDIFRKLGAHPSAKNGVKGIHFAVWAPHAAAVHLIGEFNGWDEESIAL